MIGYSTIRVELLGLWTSVNGYIIFDLLFSIFDTRCWSEYVDENENVFYLFGIWRLVKFEKLKIWKTQF